MVLKSVLISIAMCGFIVVCSALSDGSTLAYDCIAKSNNEFEYMRCTGEEYAYYSGVAGH